MHNNDNDNDIEFVEEDDEGQEISIGNKLKKIQEELKKCKKERDENLSALQRARADYINLKRDVDKSNAKLGKFAKEKVLTDLFPVLDAFDMAIGNKEVWEKVEKNWRIGIEYIHSQLLKVLDENNVYIIDNPKEAFDPEKHEPLETIETDDKKQDNIVAQIIQKGYVLGDRVLRSAKVKVYKIKK